MKDRLSFKNNRGLWDKKRFRKMEEERMAELRNLSLAKSIRMMESLLSSKIILDLKDNFFRDNPLSLKRGLKIKGNVIRRGI